MKYLSLQSNFDLQKQRIFLVKSVFKKKFKTKFIYLFSMRKYSLLYAKPQYLNFQNLVYFKKGGFFSKQKNFVLRGLTGLPVDNLFMRFKYFDYNNVMDRISFFDRYTFEIFSSYYRNFNLNINQNYINNNIRISSKKIYLGFFYFLNVLYSFKSFNKNLCIILKKRNKNKFFLSNSDKKNLFYFFFNNVLYKRYLLQVNLKFLKLRNILQFLNKMYLYSLDLLLYLVKSKLKNFIFCHFKIVNLCVNNIYSKQQYCRKQINNKNFFFKKKFYYLKKQGGHFFFKKKIDNVFFVKNLFMLKKCYQIFFLKCIYFCQITKIFNNLQYFDNYLLKYIFNLKKNIYLYSFLRNINSIQKSIIVNFSWKKNLFYFNKFKVKTYLNSHVSDNFFFKNFILYNVKYFKKYKKYFFNKKGLFRILKKKQNKNFTVSNSKFFGVVINKQRFKLNHIFSLFYFFSLLLNRRHWFYFYKLYMPILQLKGISCNNLDINFKVKFLSWYKKHKLYLKYKNNLCFLHYKNKYLFIYFYSYLFFKQLIGIRIFNILNSFYLSNSLFFFTNYIYNYINLTSIDFYNKIDTTKKIINIKLKKNRLFYIKNLLNLNINKFLIRSNYILHDFIGYNFSLFYNYINHKFYKYIIAITKKNNFLKCIQQQKYLFFFFKKINIFIKKILFIKYLFYKYFINNIFFFSGITMLLPANIKFIFDLNFIMYFQYILLLKVLLLLLKFISVFKN